MKTVHLTNAYHATSGGVRTLYSALLATANRLQRPTRLIVPGAKSGFEEVGEYGRIYYVKSPPAPFDRRYRVILPQTYAVPRSELRTILHAERPDLIEICDKYSLFYLAGLVRKGWLGTVGRPTLIGTSAERMDDNVAAFVSHSGLTLGCSRWYMRHIYTPMFDYHVANSEYTAAELRTALPRHRQHVVRVLPPGVDLWQFDVPQSRDAGRKALGDRFGISAHDRVLLYAGRLSPEKNVGLLADTMAILANESPRICSYKLIVAGDGPSRTALEQRAAARSPGRVFFVGNISDRAGLSQLYAAADVFVHPNPREPFGIAPLEAMAAGVPVVVPASGGVLTYADESNAWLAPPSPAAFAVAIRAAASGSDRDYKVMLARERAGQFSMTRSMQRLFSLYDQLHQQRQRAAHRTAQAPCSPELRHTSGCTLSE